MSPIGTTFAAVQTQTANQFCNQCQHCIGPTISTQQPEPREPEPVDPAAGVQSDY